MDRGRYLLLSLSFQSIGGGIRSVLYPLFRYLLMKIKIPEGYEIPPDAEEGGEFNAVCLFKDNEDGTITLLEIDESPLEKKEPKKDKSTVYDRAKQAGIVAEEF